MSVLMIFVDGFGLGEQNACNPYYSAQTPFLDEVLGGRCLYAGSGVIETPWAMLYPTDAGLLVPGIPQSATGQTSLFTGINAAMAVGRHVKAFPTAALRDILAEHSIFKILARAGRKATFANAYRKEYFQQVEARKAHLSTSTLAVMSGGQRLRGLEELRKGRAVYQDFTNNILINWGYNINRISPGEAGSNLAALAREHDFTLYEYFITDQIGHKQNIEQGIKVLESLDEFLAAAVQGLSNRGDLIMLVSDHGNFEDMSIKSHTMNPVPTLIIGQGIKQEQHFIGSLTDITPFVLRYMNIEGEVPSR